MLTKRLIPCLDIKNGRVVKGIKFKNLNDAGDPVKLAKFYYQEGADELAILDITATLESRQTIIKLINDISQQVFIPLTVGGGVRKLADIKALLRAGADKVAINTAAVENPELISRAARRFGSQCIVVAIDAKRRPAKITGWEVMINTGTKSTGGDVIKWAQVAAGLGAGEILLTSIDRDGTQSGYDLELLQAISQSVTIPVIASGGAGSAEDIYQAFAAGQADTALVAGLLHFGTLRIKDLKKYLISKKIKIRL
ncbi:MAG: imidazole glycerol phosphate synthase subunit HisF [Candidatus Jacksonbacteria bacterium RIFOXYC2_FULL_44_29]|nr:MAG: Imidazole glycerol phosphate synthase subunit HisF [Parcubacteria group bacterium GW2011_GWA2_42_28]KKT54708.1 MAG: Imidazole glycerol phosphate synthase subunit HisF [Parcubacteria group bacterium GW2011_GWC2_44_22]OGY75307.1 MAG: imidazole glycerol phosphate synthase subunit HisF [Candidatus Jacksonbacteria bacterium RIFOXYA2_FULL_43_12]OGY76217.1 MAG: imidazole glycerol phosphate synthase subunit HisF [Candidatus Jacksonbacteria bacterium RIFOXYB2_FULL_44_15]OGY78072.1 MAG: imidazole